jgi:hypothetical protein
LKNDISINSYLRDLITTFHFFMNEGWLPHFKMQAIQVDREQNHFLILICMCRFIHLIFSSVCFHTSTNFNCTSLQFATVCCTSLYHVEKILKARFYFGLILQKDHHPRGMAVGLIDINLKSLFRWSR